MSDRAAPSRTVDERVADVRRWLEAARAVHADRARWTPALVQTTGLTHEGVELGFESLERDASETELRALVARAGDASSVHVILSANVFVAPLRAIAIARAASASVTVRPSTRDPVLTEALVAAASAAGDRGVRIVRERDVGMLGAAEVHVYGRDETLADVRRRASQDVIVRGHGAGLGVALVTRAAGLDEAARALARDVVPFDQRGCASPRVVLVVEEGASRARAFARSLHEHLGAFEERVPRGLVVPAERAEGTRWRHTLAFAGEVWAGAQHAVGMADGDAVDVACAVPPPGRHVLVVPVASVDAARQRLGPIARFVVALGTDDPSAGMQAAPRHARVTRLGSMQRPVLDGPLDLRAS